MAGSEKEVGFLGEALPRTGGSGLLLIPYSGRVVIYDDDTGFIADVPRASLRLDLGGGRVSRVSVEELARACDDGGGGPLRELLGGVAELKGFLNRAYYGHRVLIDGVPEDEYFRAVGFTGFSEVILETTDACNMRCRYCVFGGNYVGYRTHGSSYMSDEVVEAGLRLYLSLLERFKYLNPFREPVVGFYGGEPLLNFRAIEHAAELSRELFVKKGYRPRFTISTNGTLLEGRVARFLAENDFAVFVSIDGPKEEHDRNRVMADGSGSFDRVMSNVRSYSRMLRSLGIEEGPYALATYDIGTNLFKLRDFFNSVKDVVRLTFINMVRQFDTEYYSRFSKEDVERFKKIESELAKEFLEYVKSGAWRRERDVFLDAYFGRMVMAAVLDSKLFRMVSPLLPASRTCVPPHKLYVTAKGDILPCERCPSEAVIGDVRTGLDYGRVRELIGRFQRFQEGRCLRCGIRHSCSSCIATLYPFNGGCGVKCKSFLESLTKSLKLAAQVIRMSPEYVRFIEKVFRDPIYSIGW